MGTWPLWIAFNAGVALVLLLDQGWIHRRAETISLRAAALESAGWIALSLGFGAWIYISHGRGPGLEFFTGYLVEKSLSADNVFVFLLVFQYFRVDRRFQHHLLYWGVLGAIILRGAMIAAGAALIARFAWVPYLLGLFLLYSGFQLFGADHAVRPEKNLMVRWAQKFLPMSDAEPTGTLFVRQSGKWLFTSFFLVVIVLETTDLILAVDSIAAVFGVTRDPFLIYTSNVCAILGLRALYFLLAGILPYFQYLDEGLAITVMFIGAKMLAAPWVHISTGLSLAIVGCIIGLSVVISVVRTKSQGRSVKPSEQARAGAVRSRPAPTAENIQQLAERDPQQRARAADDFSSYGITRTLNWLDDWSKDDEFRSLLAEDRFTNQFGEASSQPKLTVGIAVLPETFQKIRAANGSPPLADAPADQDVIEFELEFARNFIPPSRMDILTTKAPSEGGAIARYLEKFGEGIQQIELDVTNVDRATEILHERFHLEPIYPATRAGANATRVNFFLVPTWNNSKVLVELVEQPKGK
jgi:tellurite resistance protein TerC